MLAAIGREIGRASEFEDITDISQGHVRMNEEILNRGDSLLINIVEDRYPNFRLEQPREVIRMQVDCSGDIFDG